MELSLPKSRGIPPEERKRAVRRHGAEKVTSQMRVSRRNRQRVFEEIVISDGPSAKDLTEITGLGQSTVLNVLQELTAGGLIYQEVSTERAVRGRRPRPIRVNNRRHYIAGVEILPTGVQGLVTDLNGEPVIPLEVLHFPTDRLVPDEPIDPDMIVDSVRALVEMLTGTLLGEREDAPRDRPLIGLGAELGGHVDGNTGVVVRSPNLRLGGEWTDPVYLRQRLRDATRLHTVVENDVNALGIAQRWFGVGRGLESFYVLYVAADGIGGAAFSQGEIDRGATGAAGEPGHLIVTPNGPRCRCKGRGCLEAVATPDAVARDLGTDIDGARLLAGEGDASARKAFTAAGQAMGRAITSICLTKDPGTIVFTGDQIRPSSTGDRRLVLINDEYHEAMHQVLSEHPMVTMPPDAFQIIPDDQHWNGPRGAATLVIRDVIAGVVKV